MGKHHPVVEEIVDVLCNITSNKDRGFFQVEVVYYLSKMAACMRAIIATKDRGDVPINAYVIALAHSGYGKGHSVNEIETKLINRFKNKFLNETMPKIAEQHLARLASLNACKNNSDPQTEFDALQAAYKRCGSYLFTFDSATTPAIKQLREKLLLAACGSINLQIDEIGSNLVASDEPLKTFLELFDQGYLKQKLIKNTVDNIRVDDIDGRTPANMLLFGTPVKLMDGATTEELFYSFLETGYARRCLFGYGSPKGKAAPATDAKAIFERLINPSNNSILSKWANVFEGLADISKYGTKIDIPDEVSIALIAYRLECENQAEELGEYEEIKKAELSHRYFRALKLAGLYAFIDGVNSITMDHLEQAITLVEESGVSFQRILTREAPYMKLAKYIAGKETEMTHADLAEALPFYKGTSTQRNELMGLARAWGYKNHIVIKKSFLDGIEFFSGETLKQTNLDSLILSYGNHFAYNYRNDMGKFSKLEVLAKAPGLHWVNHHLEGGSSGEGHRHEDSVLGGFNLVVLDIDGTTKLELAQELLQDYTYFIYTTKSHTPESHRFRMILPINYTLKLSTEDYKEFMDNVMKWLPFEVDSSCNQRAKKWESNPNGICISHEGILLDALQFIPKTSRNEEFQREFKRVENMDNLERWFAERIANGNRNNNMIKFAMALVDSGLKLEEVKSAVKAFNKKLSDPLPIKELESTIFVTIGKKYE